MRSAYNNDNGIAIGPILFVVAILGILAAAIAAGSGSFSSSTTTEADRAKAAALIEIGFNLKFGVDKLVGNGYDATTIVIDPNSTTNSNDLFSPSGGGIIQPSQALLGGTNGWQYLITQSTGGFGTTADDLIAYGQVPTLSMCTAINKLVNGVATPPTVAIALFATGNAGHTAFNADFGTLKGKMTGCFYTTHVYSLGYWFYQVLAIQ